MDRPTFTKGGPSPRIRALANHDSLTRRKLAASRGVSKRSWSLELANRVEKRLGFFDFAKHRLLRHQKTTGHRSLWSMDARVSGRLPVQFDTRLTSAREIHDRVCAPHFVDPRAWPALKVAQMIKQVDGLVAS